MSEDKKKREKLKKFKEYDPEKILELITWPLEEMGVIGIGINVIKWADNEKRNLEELTSHGFSSFAKSIPLPEWVKDEMLLKNLEDFTFQVKKKIEEKIKKHGKKYE